VLVDVAVVDFEDSAGHPIEQVAVVGHDQQAARVGCQALFEPVDRIDVQVVRRLVEHE